MRYKRNPSDWQMYDRETASLRERLRAAQETLNGYGVNTKGDPRFQGIRPDAGWANKDLRPAVESVEQDVKFYADFFQKRNPRKRCRNPGNKSKNFRVDDYVTVRPAYSEKFSIPGEIVQVDKLGGSVRYMVRLASGKLLWADRDQVRKATEGEISWLHDAKLR